jgi:thioester reductase-like protein
MNVAWTPKIYEAVVARLGIRTVLYTRLTPPTLPGLHALHTPSLDMATALPALPLAPEPHYALINQSSGTTGPPKSVPVRTAMYARFCPLVTPAMPRRVRAAFVTAPSFSGVTAGIYLAPYTRGVCVYPGVAAAGAKGYTAAEIAANVARMLAQDVHSVGLTASLYTLFDATLPAAQTFPGLRAATFGGELTPPHVLRAVRRRFPRAAISVGFSSTESVQGGFGVEYPPDFDLDTLDEVVVRPNRNVEELLLLDAAGRPVPLVPGATGRVAIVTAASADPYLVAPEGRRTEQDAKDLAAAADTFRTTADGRRLVAYGDRAVFRGAAGIAVLGREGRRIKRNGVFVDLGALDALLLRAFPARLADASTLAAGRVLVCLAVGADVPALAELNAALARDTDVALGMARTVARTPIALSGKKDWAGLQALADAAAADELAQLPALPPDDALAHAVAGALADVLAEPRLRGKDAPLARVGVDSIGGARLLAALRALDGGARLRGEDVLEDDASVARLAARMRGERAQEPEMGRAFLDAEVARLAPQVRVLDGPADADAPVRNIVLTGATGYLGSFVLAEALLAHPAAHVWCITRAGGLPRVLAALARTRVALPQERVDAQVHALQGDLGADGLGLSAADAAHVRRADLILHNGALVHWTRPYRALLGPNVHSLLALLALAASHTRLVFVSGGGQTALDEGRPEAFAGANGYTASKYVAERLCARAGARVAVVRPGYIVGDPVCNADDFLWRLARTAAELRLCARAAPGAAPMNAAPVRLVARRVLAPRGGAPVDRIWVECALDALWDALAAEGYALRATDDAGWDAALDADLAARGAEHPLVALAPFARGMSGGLGYPRPAGLPRETIEDGVLQGCVRYLRETGAIPAPDGSWASEEGRIGRSGR